MNDNTSNIDFNNVMKLAKDMSKTNSSPIQPTPTIDELINSQDIRIMKATLPYLDYNNQKKFAVIIKLMEFKKTMELFNDPCLHTNQKLPRKEPDTMSLITDIRNSCDINNQNPLNMFITLMNFKEFMKKHYSNSSLLTSNVNENENTVVNNQPNNDNYDSFINMINKVIKEKDGE